MAVWALLGIIALSLLILSFLFFALVSLRERERRAAGRAGLVSSALGLWLAALLVVPPGIKGPILIVLLGSIILALLWLAAPPRPHGRLIVRDPPERVDERDIIFARFDLKEGTPRFDEYYARRPQYREADDETRKLPDILSPSHMPKAPALFALADAEFDWLEHQLVTVDGPVLPGGGSSSAEMNSRVVKETVRYLGADLCGVCEMEPAFIYSHVGRGPEPYGKPIELDHSYAIVFAVEMDFSMIAAAPLAPVIVETAKQYLAAARIASVTAGMIRRLGFPARAHMAGSNYAALVPPLAWKAGLGEVGRIGFLLTEKYGPRVRLGLVTTDMPLIPDQPRAFGVQDFCVRCRKCALNCPSHAIPEGKRDYDNGVLRWVIDRESCYRYWRKVGTDCARCIFVCPYSKPDTLLHEAVRWAAARSTSAQILAAKADDFFYGRRPRPHAPPFSE